MGRAKSFYMGYVIPEGDASGEPESIPLTDCQKLLQVIMSATRTPVPNLVQIRPRELLCKYVKYNDIKK